MMMLLLNVQGPKVATLVKALRKLGYYSGPATDLYDAQVKKAVQAFQMQNVDIAGRPLVVDGKFGPVTSAALEIKLGKLIAPVLPTPSAVVVPVFKPAATASARGLAALAIAVAEYNAGNGEEGGDNRGPHVRKYLNGLADEGKDWCAGFVSWCFSQSGEMPFKYTVGARDILAQLRSKGRVVTPTPADPPKPGDIIVWWRKAPSDWRGHVGMVLDYQGGVLTTIEGNKTPKVWRFAYTFATIDRLLGFARV